MAQKINQSSSKASALPQAQSAKQLHSAESARLQAGASAATLRKLPKDAKEIAEKDGVMSDQDVVASEETRDVILAQAAATAAPVAAAPAVAASAVAPATAGLSIGTIAAIGAGIAVAASGGGSQAAPSPTFRLTTGAAAVNEGQPATFTLTTTNVANGTQVPYTITGVAAADVSGDLTGVAVVQNNSATITVNILADAQTEGAENLTVTLNGKSVSATAALNDTSITTYTIEQALELINDGEDLAGAYEIDFQAGLNLGNLSVEDLSNYVEENQATIIEIFDNAENRSDRESFNVTYHLVDTLQNLVEAPADIFGEASRWSISPATAYAPGFITVAEVQQVQFILAGAESGGNTSFSYGLRDSITNLVPNGIVSSTVLPSTTVVVTSVSSAAAPIHALINATTGTVSLSALAGLTGTSAHIRAIFEDTQVSIGSNVALTLSGSSAATDLLAIDGFTTRLIDAQGISTLTGSATDVMAVYTATQLVSPTIRLDDDYAVSVSPSSETLTVAQANQLRDDTSGTITATISENSATTLAGLTAGNNAYTITVSGAASVTEMNTINDRTSVLVTAADVTTLTGTASDLVAHFSVGGITYGTTFTVTVSNAASGPTSATDLIEIEGVTTGTVTATAVTAITGTVDQIEQIRLLDVAATLAVDELNTAVTLTDAANAANAAKLVAINTHFNPVVDATEIISITGAEADVRALITADGATINIDQANSSLTVTLTDTTATAANLKTISDHFTGQVDMRAVTLITGTPADASALVTAHNAGTVLLGSAVEFDLSGGVATVAQLNAMRAVTSGDITAVVQESDAVTLLTLTGSQTANNYDISVSGPTSAENITTIAAKTSVVLDATGVLNMTANNAVNARAVFDATDINTAPAVAVSIPASSSSAGSPLSAADLIAINAATTGNVYLSGLYSNVYLSGLAAELVNVAVTNKVGSGNGITYEANSFVDQTFFTVTAGIAATADLNSLNGASSNLVNATAVTGLTGAMADYTPLITALNGGGQVSLSANTPMTVTDAISVTNANLIHDLSQSGVVTATISPVTITTAKTLTGVNAYAITLTDDAENFSAADFNAINNLTTVKVNATGITDNDSTGGSDTIAQIIGTGAEWKILIAAVKADTIDLPANFAAVVTGVVEAQVLIDIDAETSTEVLATGVTSISGTAAEVAAVVAAHNTGGRISIDGDYTVTVLNDTTNATSAAHLIAIDGDTTGVVTATAVTAISGTVAEVNTVVVTNTATTLIAGGVNLTVTGTGSAVVLAAINDKTSAVVNATGVTDITSSAYANIWAQVHGNTGIAFSNAFTVTVSDSQTVANLNPLSAKTTGAVTATVTETAIATLLNLTETNNVYTINVAGAASVQQLTELDAKTTGTVNLSGLTTLTGTSDELAAFLTALPAGFASRNTAVAVTVEDSSRISTVTELNAINGATTGLVNATAVTRISGTAAELIALDAVATGEMTTSTTYTATVFGTATAAQLNLVDGQTTGTVIATGVTAVTAGLLADYTTLRAALTAGTVTLSANTPMTVTSSELLTVSEANAIYDLAQSGVVTATIAGGTAATLVGLSGTGNAYSLTVTDAATTVADLLSLDAKTSVIVDALAVVTSITGNGAEWTSLMNAHLSSSPPRTIDLNGGTGVGAYNAVITGEVTWATVGLINGDTSVTVKMDGVTIITGAGGADTINLSDAGLSFTANTSSTEVSAGGGVDVVTASVGRDTIDGGEGADTINLSTAVTGSGGRDTVVVQTVATGAIDAIVNFNAEDNNGSISLDDVVKFADVSNYRNLESDGNYNIYGTLVEAIARAADTLTTAHGTSVGGAAAFVYGSDKYVFIDGGTNGYSSLDDAVVKITGTDLALLSAGNFIA